MAAFKQHVSFGFRKGRLMSDPQLLFEGVGKTSMSALRVEKPSDLPADPVLIAYIKEAVELDEKGIRRPRAPRRKPRGELEVPDDLVAALARNKKARATFDGFSFNHRKEYVEWITEAKREATRKKRLTTAIEWLAEGKPRNWKCMKGER